MPERVGLIASLPEEMRPVKRRLRLRLVAGRANTARGTYRGMDVTAMLAGVGADAAATAARRLAAEGCDLLVSLGFAGGLDPSLASGTALAVARVLAPDGNEVVPARVASLPRAVLVTSARAVGGAEQKASLRRSTGADLVDMETLAVATTAESLGLPWMGLRAVSDSASDTLPLLVQRHVRADLGRVETGRIVFGAMVAPWTWPALIGLAVRSTRAGNALAAAVSQMMEELA